MEKIAGLSDPEQKKYIEAVNILKGYNVEFESTTPAVGNFHSYKGQGTIEGVEVQVRCMETWDGSSMNLYSDDPNAPNVLKQTPLGKLLNFA